MISLIDLMFIYTLYVIAIGIVYDFEITIFEALKKSIALPLTPFRHLISILTPLTPLQKEIREEERTIKKLKAHRADMDRLAELRQERESLFEEVGDKHVERVEDRYRLTFNGVEINKLFATEEEAFTYAEAASDNNYFEAEVRRVD